jgi:hypothetical protein
MSKLLPQRRIWFCLIGIRSSRQEERTIGDPWADEIKSYLERPDAPTRIKTRELFGILGIPISKQNQLEAKRLRQVMPALGWVYRHKIRFPDERASGYLSPAAPIAVVGGMGARGQPGGARGAAPCPAVPMPFPVQQIS